MLESDGFIRIKREKRKIWVFHSALNPDEDNIRISLRKETCKKILVFLVENKIASFVQIRDAIKKSPSTTSLTMKTLVEKKVIKKINGFPNRYTLMDHHRTVQILNTAEIAYSDKIKDRFADTFSYF